MIFGFKVAALSLLAFANAVAPEVSDSPTNVKYEAVFNKTILGSVSFSSPNGTVMVDVDISGLPATGGPFQYHVHVNPVPSNGSCIATGGHLNPYGGVPNAASWDTAEVGDLSGKHGLINGTSLMTSYFDPFLSLNPDDKAYIGGLSVVFHYSNTTRLACANITKEAVSSTNSTNSTSTTMASSKAGAAYIGAGLGPLAVGAVALLL